MRFQDIFAYAGVAALEALGLELMVNKKWSDKWTGLEGLPVPGKAKD
jgi:hypothetical protein